MKKEEISLVTGLPHTMNAYEPKCIKYNDICLKYNK